MKRLYGHKPKEPVKKESGVGGYVRPVSRDEYHTWRWTKESKKFRDAHPYCAICWEKGKVVKSEVVDHIIPVAVCTDFWDQSNWQTLCRRCNMIKGNRDKRKIQKNNGYEQK